MYAGGMYAEVNDDIAVGVCTCVKISLQLCFYFLQHVNKCTAAAKSSSPP